MEIGPSKKWRKLDGTNLSISYLSRHEGRKGSHSCPVQSVVKLNIMELVTILATRYTTMVER